MDLETFRLCQKIGIETLKELKRFFKEERKRGESSKNCLKRYYAELGGSAFKIVHAQVG